MKFARRQFLAAGAAATTWALLGRPAKALEPEKATPQVGFQLYTLRGAFAKDVPGTLEAVAEMGYAGVEFWGYGGGKNVFQDWTAPKLRKLLDDFGIVCCGMHLSPAAVGDELLPQTIEVNQTLGNPRLIVAAARERMQTKETIAEFADYLDRAAERAAADGMRVGYHTHGFDMAAIDGKTAWERLFEQVSPKVLMQLDTGNCAGGGGDPIAILEKFPGRAETVHIKEFGEARFEPDNAIYEKIFHLCETIGGTQWFVVEQGGPGGLDFDIPRRCREQLRAMGK